MAIIDPELASVAASRAFDAVEAASAALNSMPRVDEIVAEVLQSTLGLLGTAMGALSTSSDARFALGFGVALLLVMTLAKPALEGAPYASGATAYTPDKAERYYGKRAPLVAFRVVRLAALTAAFNAKLFLDWRFSNLEKNEKYRAAEALVLCTQLGPTFIKLGQALSIRTDLIPEAYALELRALQDAVPPFDSEQAREIMRAELNVADLSMIFQKISDKPIASASIGQVYKGTLKDGREVAVKVQRPNILSEIALDLYILRFLTPLQVYVTNWAQGEKVYPEDITLARALVDEWGRGFVAETDYVYEAQNTETFVKAMLNRGLDAVTAPTVVRHLSTRKVLTTEWVDGTRLDRDTSPDVPRLCAVAINAYLTMLLDTGCLHCDPHPGNLLRTRDGRLCILDWGMTLPVPNDLQYSLIEFIAHVNAEDLDQIPQDFVNLGFTPADKVDQVRTSGMTEGVAFVLRQLGKGGGPKKMGENILGELKERYGEELTTDQLREKAREEMKQKMTEQLEVQGVDVQGVTNVVEEMSRRNRELFKVPPYILYVSRAFATLEGIGLTVEEDYSIVKQAFPYLSRRLLTDNSPRAKAALRSMIYGTAKERPLAGAPPPRPAAASDTPSVYGYDKPISSGGSARGLAKLLEMSDGFSSYTASTIGTDADDGARESQEALVELLTAEKGGYVQELLLEEAARLADAVVRERITQAAAWGPAEALGQMLRSPKRFLAENLPFALPGPLSAPLDLLDELASLIPSLAAPDEGDRATLETLDKVWDKLAPRLRAQQDERAVRGERREPAGPLGELLAPIEEILGPLGLSADRLWPELNDPDSALRKQLPRVGNLSRKFGVALLRRVAARVELDGQTEVSKPLQRAFSEVLSSRATTLAIELEGEAAGEVGALMADIQVVENVPARTLSGKF